MRLVNSNEIAYTAPGTRHRDGNIRFKYLLRGEAGSPQNYEFMLAHTGAGFPSPAHHHNFDQIRFGLAGTFGDGRGTEVKAGHCGYYPEGAWYSIDSQESEVILLQFGGASGSGFTHFPQLFEAYGEVSKLGEFRGGRFYRAAGAGEAAPKGQDGYEALWQHIYGKPMAYPGARYAAPIIMNPGAYSWLPYQPGVSRKVLGLFTERGIEIGLFQIQANARLSLPSPRAPWLVYVLEGAGESEQGEWSRGVAAELLPGDLLQLRSRVGLTFLYSVLPSFDQQGGAA